MGLKLSHIYNENDNKTKNCRHVCLLHRELIQLIERNFYYTQAT